MASHLPFSCTSTGPEATSSASTRSSSAAVLMPVDYRLVIVPPVEFMQGSRAPDELVEQQAGDAQGGILVIPVGGHVFEVELEVAALPGGQRGRARAEQAPSIAEDDLVENVAEFDGHFHFADGARAVVGRRAEQNDDLLVQEVGHAAYPGLKKPDLLRVGLLGGRQGQALLGWGLGRAGIPRQQEDDAEQYQNHGEADKKRRGKAAFFFLDHATLFSFGDTPNLPDQRPNASRRMSGSGSPASFMRCWTAPTL